MKMGTARLIKLETENGLWHAERGVSLGKKYRVDLDSVEVIKAFNEEKGVLHEAEMIWIYGSSGFGGWFPTELLDISGELQDNPPDPNQNGGN